MTSNRLTENQVNYVVWRYLQESGFGEAAVKLQRDWNANPQDLPFAGFVKTHALVNLIHKGLQYSELETALIENGRCRGSPEYIFGPPSKSRVTAEDDDDGGNKNEGDAMQIDAQQPNGVQTQTTQTLTSPTLHLPPPPAPPPPPQPAPPVIVRTPTSGPSVSTQMESILELTDRSNMLLKTETSHVMYGAWNPVDPNCLATAGTRKVIHIWKIIDPTEVPGRSPSSSFLDLTPHDYHKWIPTALGWNPSGTLLALAAYDDENIYVNRLWVWTKEGAIQHVIMPAYRPMLVMSWNPTGEYLLGICTDGEVSDVKVWDAVTGDAVKSVEKQESYLYAIWTGDEAFFVAGNTNLDKYRMNNSGNVYSHDHPRIPGQIKVLYWRQDEATGTLAAACEDRKIELYKEGFEPVHCFGAHTDTITGIEWQPLRNRSLQQGEPRLLASCSEDGTIRIFNGVSPFQMLRCYSFGRSRLPVLNMAFSPDGAFIAGASAGKVLIFDVHSYSLLPRASWELKDSPQANGADVVKITQQQVEGGQQQEVEGAQQQQQVKGGGGQQEDGEFSDEYDTEDEEDLKKWDETPPSVLSWNADATKLVHTYGKQIAIIHIPRLD